MGFIGSDLIRVFEHDPDLLADLDEAAARHLRTRVGTRRMWAEEGPWTPSFEGESLCGHLGLLVVDGLLTRTMCLAGRERSEIVGPGDLVRPWDLGEDGGELVEHTTAWRVLQPATLAVLDARFAAAVAPWPAITAQLLSRTNRRCRTLVFQATVAHVRHAPTRLLLTLWHLADRWGRVTPEGVVLRMPLTHQLLAQLTCLQRPTVSSALGHLAADGRVTRRPDGGWTLHGAPPTTDEAPGHERRRGGAELAAA